MVLSNFDSLLKLIKQAAVDAVNASSPADFVVGVVISTSPLRVKIDQKITLSTAQLQLTRNVSKHTLKMNGTDTEIDNSLISGDKIILARCQGGQQYIVLDKVV